MIQRRNVSVYLSERKGSYNTDLGHEIVSIVLRNGLVRKISGRDELYTVGIVLQNYSFYLNEICQNIRTTLGICVRFYPLHAVEKIWNN